MAKRTEPEDGANSPELVRSLYQALEHSATPTEAVFDRLAATGNAYHIGTSFTITPTQGSAYFYIDNSGNSSPFVLGADSIKVAGGNARVYVRDEPTLDVGTFNTYEFRNVRSDVTPSPNQSAYFGYDNNVTVTDKGRLYDENFIKASTGSVGTTSTGTGKDGKTQYIIGDDSTALLEVMNDSSNEIEVSISAKFFELPEVPDIIENGNA